jgi:hypothetical protein
MFHERLVTHFLYFLLIFYVTNLAVKSHETYSINLVNFNAFHITVLYKLRDVLQIFDSKEEKSDELYKFFF